MAGRISHRLWHEHQLLYWPAVSHRKHFFSLWPHVERSALSELQGKSNHNILRLMIDLHPGAQVTFVVGTGVGQIHKFFKVPHLLWDVEEQLHRLILAVFEVQQRLHQSRFAIGLICGGTFVVLSTHQSADGHRHCIIAHHTHTGGQTVSSCSGADSGAGWPDHPHPFWPRLQTTLKCYRFRFLSSYGLYH